MKPHIQKELLRKLDEHYTYLLDWNFGRDGYLPEYITFIVGKSSYKIRNNRQRISSFRQQVVTNQGFTGKFRSHADIARSAWKRAGCRGRPERNAFQEAVLEAAEREQGALSDLKSANWRLGQFREQELKAERNMRAAVDAQEEVKREIAKFTEQYRKALLDSSQARSESAEFEAHLQEIKSHA